jgi:hypothetical protein
MRHATALLLHQVDGPVHRLAIPINLRDHRSRTPDPAEETRVPRRLCSMRAFRTQRRFCQRLLLVLASLAIGGFLLAGTATAHAETPGVIGGVWSFNGGRVAIQRQADGSWTGTVVAPTRFAECSHPVGEVMWTGMRATTSGAWVGLHQWFFVGAACVPNPQLGLTAWRLLEAKGGAHFLRACFSEPGDGQPEISSTGVATGASFGCVDSALLAPSPATSGAAGFELAVTLPSARSCVSRRVFRIHLRDPKNDPLREAVVTLRGRRLRVLRHGNRFASTVDLRGLPPGTFTVRIRLTTVLGHTLSGSRRFHTCVVGPRRNHAR